MQMSLSQIRRHKIKIINFILKPQANGEKKEK